MQWPLNIIILSFLHYKKCWRKEINDEQHKNNDCRYLVKLETVNSFFI